MPAVSASIALIGDYSPEIPAHQAIPLALKLAARSASGPIEWVWISTRDLSLPDLEKFDAIWVVPGSPYQDMARVLESIRWSRVNQRPFLGTCGGFQHALIEFSRNVLGLKQADHAESSPHSDIPVVSRLACTLVEKKEIVRFLPGSRLREIYGVQAIDEGYHCNYGLNPQFRERLERAGMCFSAENENGAARAVELPSSIHPFFIGTLFQPERAALVGATPPLALALVKAAARQSKK